MAQTSVHFSVLANDVFRRQYGSQTLLICDPFDEEYDSSVNVKPPNLNVNNFNMLTDILRIFGAEIHKIDLIHHHIELNRRYEIHNLIAQYCSMSLTTLRIHNGPNMVMPGFQTPLKGVQHVLFYGTLGIIGKTNLKLNQMFPSVRELSLQSVDVMFPTKFKINFPQLKRVNLSPNSNISAVVKNLFEMNQQIEIVSFSELNSSHYLKLVSNLPNVRELSAIVFAKNDEDVDDEIRFETLNKFGINLGEFDYFDSVTFDQVEELELVCTSNAAIKYKQFTEAPGLYDARILKMAQKAPKLKVISIVSLSEMLLETIERIIVEHGDLHKIHLVMSSETLFNEIKRKFETDWHIVRDNSTLSMERR